jgi:ATP-dependent Lon protease
VSAMSGRPVRRDVAMTGEITLRGRVLPIGGVKEKVLGAHRAGISTIILPKDNEADMEDIPEDVRKQLTFHCVSTLDEVFDIALVPIEQPPAVQPTLMEEMEEKAETLVA